MLGQGGGADHECLLVTCMGKPLTDVTLAQLWASIQETHKAPWGAPVTLRMFRHGYATRAHAAVLHGIAAVGPSVLQPKADAMGNSLRMWKEVYIDGRRGAIAQTATRIAATFTTERGGHMHDVGVGTDGPGSPGPSRSQSPGEGTEEYEEVERTESASGRGAVSATESTCSSGRQDAGQDREGVLHTQSRRSDAPGSVGRPSDYGGPRDDVVGARKRRLYRVVESSPSPSRSSGEGGEEEDPVVVRKRMRGSVGTAVQGPTVAGSEVGAKYGAQPHLVTQDAPQPAPSMGQVGRIPAKANVSWLSFLGSGNR
jgi:hypothetical protein